MTSKVEDLLEDIDRDLGDCNKAPDCSYFHNRMVDLIFAARSEGVAEGAEKERERISYNSWAIPMGEVVSQCAETLYSERGTLVAGKDLRIIPASVLAPKAK